MTERVSERTYDPERTIVVSNFPADVGEDELTIHFQKEKNGGGDVDDVMVDGSVAFVIFDLPEVAASVLSHSEQVINETKIEVQSYEFWFTNKKKKESPPVDNPEDSHVKDTEPEDAVKTIYVSGINGSTPTETIAYFFENKKRAGGGELCEGEEGFKRLSSTAARLTFVSSKDAQGVLKKAEETPLKLGGNVLKVSAVFVPTHDQSILLAKNLNPKTSKETLQDFVESTKNADVFNVVLGKDGKAIVILKDEIDEDRSDIESSNEKLMLEEFAVSLEFAPLTSAIRISNIPQGTSSDAIKFRFSNRKAGGNKVCDMKLDRDNGIAIVYFEEYSAVSRLVKKEHKFENISLTVIPYYEDFEELQKTTTRITEFQWDYHLDHLLMDYILNHEGIESKFDLKGMKYDKEASRFYVTKDFDDPKLATEFENKLKEFLRSFVKEDVKIPKGEVFDKVKKAIEDERNEFNAAVVDVSFDGSRVIFVGKKDDVDGKKQLVETMVDRFTEEGQKQSTDFVLEDKNKLKFLNFIDYFADLTKEFPDVKIHGADGASGKLSLLGTTEKTRDIQLRILQDMMRISEISVKTSVHQIDFLQRTQCKIVNDELKKDDAMLLLINVEGALQAKIMRLKKCDDNEKKRLVKVFDTKISEKCIKVDEETTTFLSKSNKLQEFKKEQFDKHQVMIDLDLIDPRNIWIVCENSKIYNAEQELTSLIDEKKIISCTFKLIDPMKLRFLREHCWGKIKEKEKNCEAEGVLVLDIDANSLEVKGTKAGRNEMRIFLEKLAGNVDFKTYSVNEPGMRKQMSMNTTDTIISEVEKNHKCVIEKGTPPVEASVILEETTSAGDEKKPTNTSGASTMNLPYHSMSFLNSNEVKLASGQRITLVVGNLAQQTVDVIVNTTNDAVNLNANPCGRALLKVAGNELLNECQQIGSLQAGEMVSTGAANLNCKRVFHVRSAHWGSGKGARVLRHLIKKCLKEVETEKLTSIAFPAIGTGALQCPRPEVAKIFFEEVTSFLKVHPQSTISDVRFVAYDKDQATVDAFFGALQEIKSVISSPPSMGIPVAVPLLKPALRKQVKSPTTRPQVGLSNVTTSDKPDGSLELSLRGSNITVQIVCDDISKETTDLIMHVIGQDFSIQGGVAKALLREGGNRIFEECKALGKPALFSTQYTNAGDLSVKQIAHVIGPGNSDLTDLGKCVDNFFDDISKKNIARVSLSAIGAGAMGHPESQSADLIFKSLFRIAQTKNLTLRLVRIVIFENSKFLKFKDAAKAYVASWNATSSSSSKPSEKRPKRRSLRARFEFRQKDIPQRRIPVRGGISFKIYSDDGGKFDKAWEELKRKMNQNIREKIINDDMVKKFTDHDFRKLNKLEGDYDFEINVDQHKAEVKLKGHILDIANVQEKVNEILKDAKDNENKVPAYWVKTTDERKYHKFQLSTGSKEYKDVEAAFHATARNQNQIVSIERIQNEEIYGLFNLKRQAMMKKYGTNFLSKEKMLFHGTSCENVEKINAGGLNRSYAGIHATACGRGVYFARDASYSCSTTYSPPDYRGLRYMYYTRVLVGDYTTGNPNMIVAPNKGTFDPNETYDSVVDNVRNPSMYIMFQDYEYYTEYLITFR